mgnify:FL=1
MQEQTPHKKRGRPKKQQQVVLVGDVFDVNLDQAYYASEEWQSQETAVKADILVGRVTILKDSAAIQDYFSTKISPSRQNY